MSKKRNVLVVGGIKDLHKKIIERGYSITSLMSKENYKTSFIQHSESVLIQDFNKPEEILDLIKSIHERNIFEGVLCFYEKEQPLACYLAKELGLLHTTEKAANIALNKHLLRKMLNENGLSYVEFKVCNDVSDILNFLEYTEQPSIIKPVRDTASSQVYLVKNKNDLNALLEKSDIKFPVLVEEYLEGIEISVESFTINGEHEIINMTQKELAADSFVEIGHLLPYSISNKVDLEVFNTVKRALDLINHTFGPAHTEIKITDNGPKIIETHTRPGGDLIFELIEITTGINLIDLSIDYQISNLFSEDTLPKFKHNCLSSIKFFHSPTKGTILDIQGIDRIKDLSNVEKVVFNSNKGDSVSLLRNSGDRIGYVILKGNSSQEINNVWEKIKEIIKINIERIDNND